MQPRKRLLLLPLLLATSLLCSAFACSSNQRQQIAQAAQDASTVVHGFQKAEIEAYGEGRISGEDHVFMQQSVLTLARSGKTLDGCIRSASSNAGIVFCVNAAVGTVDQLNADGALHLKSAQAKTDFQLAMVGTRTALVVITTVIGGKQ